MGIAMNSLCFQCLLDKHLANARALGDEKTATAFGRELLQLMATAPEDANSAWFATLINDLYSRYYGLGQDRYVQEKKDSNEFVLQRLDRIEALIQKQPDPVFAALQFAVMGNYLDFSALQGQVSFEKLDEMLADALNMQLDKQVYAQFAQDLQQGKNLLYITDNAGEIGFDRLMAMELKKAYPHLQITFCVRGLPAHNDATREDYAVMQIPFPVVDTGNDVGGVELRLVSRECQEALDGADVILAKGMGNTESMYGCGYNVYYAFLVKCARFVEYFDKPKMTPMFLRDKNK